MDQKTLTALLGSISKWEAIVDGTGIDKGADNCPLCKEFFDKGGVTVCQGCPVAEKTGKTYCNGSPYTKFLSLEDELDKAELDIVEDEQDENLRQGLIEKLQADRLEAAREELNFLKSLLPE